MAYLIFRMGFPPVGVDCSRDRLPRCVRLNLTSERERLTTWACRVAVATLDGRRRGERHTGSAKGRFGSAFEPPRSRLGGQAILDESLGLGSLGDMAAPAATVAAAIVSTMAETDRWRD